MVCFVASLNYKLHLTFAKRTANRDTIVLAIKKGSHFCRIIAFWAIFLKEHKKDEHGGVLKLRQKILISFQITSVKNESENKIENYFFIFFSYLLKRFKVLCKGVLQV